jgi:hypothetical protein
MSESQEPKPTNGIGIPLDVIVNYLTDIHRQLDSITFNIRSNITNLQGELTNANTRKE